MATSRTHQPKETAPEEAAFASNFGGLDGRGDWI
jgi:hypothetical protein